ncbi:SGNH/GDSL hydrolase family protein [Pseudidiomarina sp. 1APP75-27a]|uniref:SGNH/GDSL hydrolase family protein n=1 Tax=Pseudidiomarina terrestris TaxID=2820060 RepID=UPI002B059874|nr:SGNH/GDSL hydrolase family protein [Pseudidiomarina sp. 1APP75-27a]MEA3588539.1 SGNH/GDSL hydrolase family protein [Pseudidiomarina sp. 1APP75-27a]
MLLHKILLPVLAPLLLLQGKLVRARTPHLPEAEGARQGQAGSERTRPASGKELRVLILGDSAAAGVGCDTQQQAVTGQWVAQLSQTTPVSWQLVAKSSLTCAQVLTLLKETQLTESRFDVVLVSVGVNDVTRRTSTSQWQADLEAMSRYLNEHLGVSSILYTALPPMHKFPALPQPLRWVLGQRAKLLNQYLAQHCQRYNYTHYLNFEVPYEAQFIAADGYHPSTAAAELWARTAAKAYSEENK